MKPTPKEKAIQLWESYSALFGVYDSIADGAMHATNEVLEFMRQDDEDTGTAHWANSQQAKYWLQVLAELKKMKGA